MGVKISTQDKIKAIEEKLARMDKAKKQADAEGKAASTELNISLSSTNGSAKTTTTTTTSSSHGSTTTTTSTSTDDGKNGAKHLEYAVSDGADDGEIRFGSDFDTEPPDERVETKSAGKDKHQRNKARVTPF